MAEQVAAGGSEPARPSGAVGRDIPEDRPGMIRDENGRLSGYVYVDFDTSKRDIGGMSRRQESHPRESETPMGYQLI